MISVLGALCLVLAALSAAVAAVNLVLLRTPPAGPGGARVSILIPARDEAPRIAATVEAALAAAEDDVEVLVGDDHSTDGTATIVQGIAERDPRVRLVPVPALPPGWTGKVHACHRLAAVATGEHLLFIDADVRLAPGAVGRLAGAMRTGGADLLSAVPRQEIGSLGEALTVPTINFLLLGYLPIGLMRRRPDPSLGAACGQLVLVRAAALRGVGGHAAIAGLLHDGVQLARLFRRRGLRTDLVSGEALAACRMYGGFAEAWAGFAKNAHEGMATPRALPVWTLLLLGGHVLPLPLVLVAFTAGTSPVPPLCALVLSLSTRLAITLRGREPLATVPLHPATVATALAIQWTALRRRRRGAGAAWKGRTYPAIPEGGPRAPAGPA